MPSKGDLKFGHLAVEMELCEKAQVEECLKYQATLEKQGKVTSIDRVMLKKGYVTLEQIAEVEKKQGRRIIFCSKCSAKLNVAIFGAGTKIRCPKCDASLVVPAGTKFEVVSKSANDEEEQEDRKKDTIRVKKEPPKPAAKPGKPAKPAKKEPPKEEEEEVDLLGDEPEEKKEEEVEEAVDSVDEVDEVEEPADESGSSESDDLLKEPEEEGAELKEDASAGDEIGGESDIEILDDVDEVAEEKPSKPALKARQNDPTEKMPQLGKAKMPPSTTKPGAVPAKPPPKGPSSRLDRFKKR
ncbi:MAG: hypothetical protein HYZ53_27575 [Planctomycetes bacterium]|nr:hypothetical protein [Planctomycetota bacterium]